MRAVAVAVAAREARRVGRVAVLSLVVVSGMALVAVAFSMALGFRTLVVRSGSMSPAIETGDVVMSQMVLPSRVAQGDVVTFRDPSRGDRLITHRVLEVRHERGRYAFVTKGDANTGIERWAVPEDGAIGRVGLRIPRAGYVISYLGLPWVRLTLLVAAAGILAASLVRRIWTG